MRGRFPFVGLFIVGAITFVVLVVWIENRERARAAAIVRDHAQVAEASLWNMDRRLGRSYFELAVASYGYERLRIVDSGGGVFWEREGPPPEGFDRVLEAIGLLPRITVQSPVHRAGTLIGRVEVVWILRTIYTELYALLALVLAGVLIERHLRVLDGKSTLEQRVAERTRQLSENEARLREQARLLDLAPDLIIVQESDGRVSYWNRRAERDFGPPEKPELLRALGGIADAARQARLRGSGSRDQEWSGDLGWRDHAGVSRVFQTSVVAMKESDGKERLLIILADVTAQKRMEEQFYHAQRTQAVGTLASGIAHDFNNLLTPIMMSSSMLAADRNLSPTAKATLAAVEQCAQRGAALVRQLLSVAGDYRGQKRPVEVGKVAEEIAQIVRQTFPKTIELELACGAGVPPVSADPTQLHQVLLNLCLNARDAMPTGGRLRIAVGRWELTAEQRSLAKAREPVAADWIRMDVADTGRGVPAEIVDRIFDPFFTTKEPGKGTGLGLAAVQGIVRSFGGFITVQNGSERGAEFSVFLPASVEAVRSEPAVVSLATAKGSGQWVLLVDDEPAVLSSTGMLLDACGYRVMAAASGWEALDLFQSRGSEVAAVLTDVMMPGMDGIALTAALRRIDPKVRVAAATGLATDEMRRRLAEAGIKHLLAKPYSPEDVLGCMRELLAGSR